MGSLDVYRKLRSLFHRQTSGCEENRAGLSFLDSNQHKPQHIGNGVLFLRPFQGGNTMKALRKPLSLFMAMLMCLGIFAGTGTTAFAATEEVGTITFTGTYDSNGNRMYYNTSAVINGNTVGGAGHAKNRMYVDGDTAYCIEPSIPLKICTSGERISFIIISIWSPV